MITSKSLKLVVLACVLILSSIACADRHRVKSDYSRPAVTAVPVQEERRFTRAVDNASYIIVVDSEGREQLFGKGGAAGTLCAKESGSSKLPACKAFSGKSKILKVRSGTVIKTAGSIIITYIDGFGRVWEFCYDDFGNPIDCSSLD